jgi:serine acetyltransferase
MSSNAPQASENPRTLGDLRATLRLDLTAAQHAYEDPAANPRVAPRLAVISPGFLAVVLYRLSAATHRAGLLPVARLLFVANTVLFGAELSPRAVAGPGLVITSPVGVVLGGGARLGRRVRISRDVSIGTAASADPSKDGFPTIGDDCVIREGARVLGPISIGARTVVDPNTLVVTSCAPDSRFKAQPARITLRETTSGYQT